MGQEKRFGKRVLTPSTVQIIRELKIMMRHDTEAAERAASAAAAEPHAAPVGGAAASGAPLVADGL